MICIRCRNRYADCECEDGPFHMYDCTCVADPVGRCVVHRDGKVAT